VLRKEGAPPVKNDKVANAVYENSGTVAEFYKTTLGRNSIDDKGMPIHSIVRQKDMDDNGEIKPMSNAYWRDRDARMRYGEGEEKGYSNFTALDITGHELTHGVTSMTAKLEYRGQSGALNESFSDVLGTAIAQWKAGVTVKQADWRIGGEAMGLRSAPGVKAIRSMSDPNSIRKQPAHMSQFKDMPIDDDHDWGGVHTNSGIPNRAFYGAAMRIGGFVWEKSSKIWYVALRDYLKKDSNFVDAAHATVHVAGELYGDGSREQQAVIAGWKDVGIAVTAGESAAMQPRAKGTEFVVVTPGKANDTKDAPAPKP
jgi:Zn-dependent metalloprotease